FWVRDFDRGPRGRLLAMLGVRPKKLWDAAAARLLVTDAELDPARDDPALAGFEWTGTTEIGAEPGARGARPRVLVALSSTEWPGMLPVYRRIVEAISDLPIDAVVTTGGAELGGDLVGTANVEVRGWVAHDELLPGVDLLIGHGGHSTTMKALAHGIPLLIIPINPTADQKLMGATMQAAGLGQWLPKSASVQSIRDAVSNLLGASTGGEHTRATAAATGRRLRAAVPGAEVAAARILAIAGAATSQTLR
ncbi:MAG TPA: glycosyltransferase, partial [Microbacteriaceae bacterium]|nr:glycosyltransferase [Microbacteriaceae bacterium]